MKRLFTTLSLMLAVLIGSTGVSYALPECEGSPITAPKVKSWDNCNGTHVLGVVIDGNKNLFGLKYVGEWKNDRPDGKGTLIYYTPSKAAGAKSVGDFRKGDFIQGIHTFPNGDKYIGEFINRKRNGQGTFISANGKYVGEWKNDRPNGLGILTHADGRIEEGMFQNGNLLRAQKVAPNKYSSTTDVTHPSPNNSTVTNNSNTNDIQSRLSKLKELLDTGLITKEEAAEKRKAILDSL
jgi:hypothetical protein